jgi:hypothetical protein
MHDTTSQVAHAHHGWHRRVSVVLLRPWSFAVGLFDAVAHMILPGDMHPSARRHRREEKQRRKELWKQAGHSRP